MKTCRVCKAAQPLEAFHLRVDSPDGRRSECKRCFALAQRMRRPLFSTESMRAANRFRVIRWYHRKYGRGVKSRYPGMVELARRRA